MSDWPETQEKRFFREMHSLSISQANEVVRSYCFDILQRHNIQFLQAVLEREEVYLNDVKDLAESLGDLYWEKRQNFANDSASKLVAGYLYWSSKQHYDVDGAMEVLDQVLEVAISLESGCNASFDRLFETIRRVKSE